MATDSRLSRFFGAFRSPFPMPPRQPNNDSDWYLPYTGPYESPRISQPVAPVDRDPFRRRTGAGGYPLEGDSRQIPQTVSSVAARSSTSKTTQSGPSFLSLDTGGIDQSPASNLPEPIPHRQSLVNRFPFGNHHNDHRGAVPSPDSHGPDDLDTFTFPPLSLPLPSRSRIPSSFGQTTTGLGLIYPDRSHPYSNGALSNSYTTSLVPPSLENSPNRRRAQSTVAPQTSVESTSTMRQNSMRGGNDISTGLRPIHTHTLSKSRSTPQNLNITTSPFSIQSHPFALATPSHPSASKPPIPTKSPNLLKTLRASASTPHLNLAGSAPNPNPKTPIRTRPRDNSLTIPTIHQPPVSLKAQSLIDALVLPKPRFKANHTYLLDPPSSPYTLANPMNAWRPDSSLNSPGIHCIPTLKSKSAPVTPQPASVFFPSSQGRDREKEDIVTQTVRDNQALSAERAKWANQAQSSFANKRSRSLSNKRLPHPPRRVTITSMYPPQANVSVTAAREREGGGNATGSLTYLAASAFGHNAKLSVDTSSSAGGTARSQIQSGGTISSRSRSTRSKSFSTGARADGDWGTRSNAHVHTRTRTNSQSNTHSHSNSASSSRGQGGIRGALMAVAAAGGCAHGDDHADNPTEKAIVFVTPPDGSGPNSQPFNGVDEEVMDIRRNPAVIPISESKPNAIMVPTVRFNDEDDEDSGREKRLTSASRIGLALSTPEAIEHESYFPDHPYAMGASPSKSPARTRIRGGPHPTTSPTQPIFVATDLAARHRLPPQAQIHASPASTSSPFASPMPVTPITQPHPFASPVDATLKGKGNMSRLRPSSGLVEEAFEDELLSLSRGSWNESGNLDIAGDYTVPWIRVAEEGDHMTFADSPAVSREDGSRAASRMLGGYSADISSPRPDSGALPPSTGSEPKSNMSLPEVPSPPPPPMRVVTPPPPPPPPPPPRHRESPSTPIQMRRPWREEGNHRRSLSLTEFGYESLPATPGHTHRPTHSRSFSQQVLVAASHSLAPSTPSPNDISSSISSSPKASPRTIGGLDDLETFRDLFYRPHHASSSMRSSAVFDESGLRRSVASWETDPQFSPRDSMAMSGLSLQAAEDDSGSVDSSRSGHLDLPQDVEGSPKSMNSRTLDESVHLGRIGVSQPSMITHTMHRYSSQPSLFDSMDADHQHQVHEEDVTIRITPAARSLPTTGPLPPPRPILSIPSYLPSGSEDDAARSSMNSNTRISGIIRGFPTPPPLDHLTPATTSILSSYFLPQTPTEQRDSQILDVNPFPTDVVASRPNSS